MNLLDSLLDAIVRLDGDALVMHVGEKPYVVTTSSSMNAFRGPLAWGQVELSSRILTSDAVLGMLTQILPLELRRSLEDMGAIEYTIPSAEDAANRFTVVAARGGDDVWLEVRRRRKRASRSAAGQPQTTFSPPPEAVVPAPIVDAAPESAPVLPPSAQSADAISLELPGRPGGALETPAPAVTPVAVEAPQAGASPVAEPALPHGPGRAPADAPALIAAVPPQFPEQTVQPSAPAPFFPAPPSAQRLEDVLGMRVEEDDEFEDEFDEEDGVEEEAVVFEISLENAITPVTAASTPADQIQVVHEEIQGVPTHDEVDALLASAAALMAERRRAAGAHPVDAALLAPAEMQSQAMPELARASASPPMAESTGIHTAGLAAALTAHPPSELTASQLAIDTPAAGRAAFPDAGYPGMIGSQLPGPQPTYIASPLPSEDSRQAVVLPISRSIRNDAPVQAPAAALAPLEHTLRVAAARGASTVYVVAESKPMIRVDGEISVLDGEPVMTAPDVERLMMDLSPVPGRDAVYGASVEWMCDMPDIGRVRCATFRDHRGPGVIFRMIPPRAISTDQLGLSSEVQALCAQPDGLVLVAGARASGKSTLLSAFVDLINRTRSDHVITIESQITFVHEGRRSFVSQREVRGDGEAAAAAVRFAIREDPDVLVIEDLRTPEIAAIALEAAESGRLVFGSLPASNTVAAVERLIELFPADRRAHAQTSLAGALRGVVAQVLLRKVKGGRVAAREVMLNTAAVANLIMEGKLFQLPVALDSGRRHGMVPLNDSLATLVREGTVHVAEAYRKALDRDALLAVLKRDGVDTSFAERLA